jgi:hypothetical protein
MKNSLCLLAAALAVSSAGAQDSTGPVSFHAHAFVTQNHGLNSATITNEASAYYFRPAIGAIGEVTVRYAFRTRRPFFETGLTAMLWNYRVGFDARLTGPLFTGWQTGRSGFSLGIPFRVGTQLGERLTASGGILFLRALSGGNVRSGFSAQGGGIMLEGDSYIASRSFSSLALDLTASFQISPRFDVALRGVLDTKAYPDITIDTRVTGNGSPATYHFAGGPHLAILALGAGFRF